ncbi:hypothetical protein BUALT_Bualt01G0122600 [Buddleja alternifolia]|uniref:CCHC-type domain-containing protein n=1 Tax=Buddleja alternifolia TaxID=168488 RepID=A0AAV6Y801_9LAMI|nr:hypothetical protein BUALT_Bualt01G0122600 [Buddleja alternifolia]
MDAEISRMARDFTLTDREATKVSIPANSCRPGEGYNPRILVGRITTDRQINFPAFKDTVIGSFRPRRGMEVSCLGNSRFLLAFNHSVDLDRVLESGPWNFDNDMIILKKLNEFDDPRSVNLDWNDIFVRVSGLPLGLMNHNVAQIIGNHMGIFVDMDLSKSGFFWDSTLRLRVRINVTKPLLRLMTLTIPGGQEVKLSFSYEKLPNFCYLCGVIGHIEDRCEIRYNQSFVHPGDHTPFGPWLRASNRCANPSRSLHFGFGEPQPAIDSSHREGHSSSWKTLVGNQTNIQSRSSSPLYCLPHIRRNSVDHDVNIPSRAPENPRGSRSRCRLRLVDESDDDLAGENLNLIGQATSSPLGTIVSNSLPVNPPPGSNLSPHAKSNSTTNPASISPQLPNPVSSSRLIEISSPIVISQHKCDRAYPALSDNISCMPPHSLPMQPTSPMHSPTPSVHNILHINPPPSPMLINIPLQISLTPHKVPKSLSVNRKIRKNKRQKISPPYIINNQTLRLTDIPVSEFAQGMGKLGSEGYTAGYPGRSFVKEVTTILPIRSLSLQKAKWQPPEFRIMKINVDGAADVHRGLAAVGVVIRDWRGSCVGWTGKFLNFAPSPDYIEALALVEGLLLASREGWPAVVLEGDCLSIISKVIAGLFIDHLQSYSRIN